jgi:integrase
VQRNLADRAEVAAHQVLELLGAQAAGVADVLADQARALVVAGRRQAARLARQLPEGDRRGAGHAARATSGRAELRRAAETGVKLAPKNRGQYPKGWRWKNGAFRYRVPPGMEDHWDGKTEFTLGATESEAYRVWAERLKLHQREANNIGEVLDRYLLLVVPTKAPKTREHNRRAITKRREVFGHVHLDDLRPTTHGYSYLDGRRPHLVAGKRALEVLSHAYTKAVQWGLVDENPILGRLRLSGEYSTPPRDRYVEDRELAEALKVASPLIRAYIGVKVLTGLRRGDNLRLRLADIQEDGIHVMPSKTANLRKAIDQAKALRPKLRDDVPFLFCTRKGEPCQDEDGAANGFDSIWQRFMAKALAKTTLAARFQERDLRAKVASDLPLALASALLGHADPKLTQRVYPRRPDLVTPAA